MAKRKLFNRPQDIEAPEDGEQRLRDPERIATGYKRVYTVVSAMTEDDAPGMMHFCTGGEDAEKPHETEPNPVTDVWYHTQREYHVRQQDKGLVIFEDISSGSAVHVVWHGYDIKYEPE